jgi:hypothetical protein
MQCSLSGEYKGKLPFCPPLFTFYRACFSNQENGKGIFILKKRL